MVSARGSVVDRIVWALVLLGSAFVLITARHLSPSPRGMGTHEQLGLPPCGFLTWVGVPCPACGLTTSFAHLAHADVASAMRVHPLGVPLFALTATLLAIASIGVLRGSSVSDFLERTRADRVALLIALCALVTWAARLLA